MLEHADTQDTHIFTHILMVESCPTVRPSQLLPPLLESSNTPVPGLQMIRDRSTKKKKKKKKKAIDPGH